MGRFHNKAPVITTVLLLRLPARTPKNPILNAENILGIQRFFGLAQGLDAVVALDVLDKALPDFAYPVMMGQRAAIVQNRLPQCVLNVVINFDGMLQSPPGKPHRKVDAHPCVVRLRHPVRQIGPPSDAARATLRGQFRLHGLRHIVDAAPRHRGLKGFA